MTAIHRLAIPFHFERKTSLHEENDIINDLDKEFEITLMNFSLI